MEKEEFKEEEKIEEKKPKKPGWLFWIGLTLVVLKLFGVISWPWLLVTLPLWIKPAIKITAKLALILIALIGEVVMAITDLTFGNWKTKRRSREIEKEQQARDKYNIERIKAESSVSNSVNNQKTKPIKTQKFITRSPEQDYQAYQNYLEQRKAATKNTEINSEDEQQEKPTTLERKR